jgi:hypothetical protein
MKRSFLLLILGIVTISFVTVSCNKDDDDNPPSEYIATDDTFKNFSTWNLGGEFMGADPALGPAHGGNDSTTVRKVYFKDNVKPSGNIYPVGAVIVKHSTNTNGMIDEYTAMVKRGNDFNPSDNDWEYFMLAGDGEIAKDNDGNAMRGANLMNGMCISCHNKAGTDYIFTQR